MTNAVTISAPATGCVGKTIAVSGTVSPATDTVSLMLSDQNTTLPTSPRLSATTANGTFAGVLAIPAPGTWYVWAWDQATGAQAVSGTVTVPNAAQTTVLAVPMPASQAGSTLPTLNDVVAEAAARQAGDSANATAISTETTNRETAITSEATARAAADTANANAISAETTRAQGVEALKAPLASPALSGTPTAPTASPLTSDAQISTTAYADAAVTVEKTRAQAAESTLTTSVGVAQSTANSALTTANAAQPAIAPNAGKVLTGPSTAGGAPGALAVGGAGGLLVADASGNISSLALIAAGAITPRSTASRAADVINVLDYGVLGNGLSASHTVTVASGTPNQFSIAGFTFTSADVGKCISIAGVGPAGGAFTSTITAVTGANQITTAANASTFISAQVQVTYGTDDGPALNTLMAQIAAQYGTALTGGQSVTVLFPQRIYYIGTSVNFTNLEYVTFQGNRSGIYGATNGHAVFDAMGAYGCVWDNFIILGDQALPPSTGIQIGRYLSGGRAFGLNRLRDVIINGYFSLACLYNMASETSYFDRISCNNNQANGYSYIADGIYHFGLTSQYVPFTLTANTPVTFTVNSHIGCRYTQGGGGVSPIWCSNFARHHYLGCYTDSIPGQNAVTIFGGNSKRITDWTFQASCEGGNPADQILNIFDINDDGTHVTSISGWEIDVPGGNATNSIFACDATFTQISLYNVRLKTDAMPVTGGLLFSNPAQWLATGSFNIGATYTFVPPGLGFDGEVTSIGFRGTYGLQNLVVGPGSSAVGGILAAGAAFGGGASAFGTNSIALGANAFAWEYGKQSRANGYFAFNGDMQDGLVMLRGSSTSTTPIRLAANGGSPGPTTVANLYFLSGSTGSARSIVIHLVARDTVTGDVATYISSPTGGAAGLPFIATIGESAATMALHGTPIFNLVTNTGGGSLAGISAPTLAADTTYGGLNITCTASGSNAIHWGARVSTVEII